MRQRNRSRKDRPLRRLVTLASTLPLEAWAIALIYGLSLVNGLFVLAKLSG